MVTSCLTTTWHCCYRRMVATSSHMLCVTCAAQREVPKRTYQSDQSSITSLPKQRIHIYLYIYIVAMLSVVFLFSLQNLTAEKILPAGLLDSGRLCSNEKWWSKDIYYTARKETCDNGNCRVNMRRSFQFWCLGLVWDMFTSYWLCFLFCNRY